MQSFQEYMSKDLGLRHSSIESYCVVVALFIRWKDLKDRTEAPDWAQLRDFLGDLKKAREYKNTALRHAYYAMRCYFGFLGLQQEVHQNPYRKVLKEESTWVTEEMIQQIEECLEMDSLDRALFLVLFSTAIRRGELLGLQVADLEARPGFIRVARLKRQSGEKWDYLPMEEKVQGAVTAYREEYGIKTGQMFQILKKGHLAPLQKDTMYRRLKRGFKAAGVAYIKPHAFRHGRLTQVTEGMGLSNAKRLAGHASATTTAGYLHSTQESMEQAYVPAFGAPKKKTGFALRQRK